MHVGHVSYYIGSIFIIFTNFLDAMRPWLTMQPYLRSPNRHQVIAILLQHSTIAKQSVCES